MLLSMDIVHKPVLKDEILNLSLKFFQKDDFFTFLDATAGQGGHSEFLLENFKKSEAILLDRDLQTIKTVQERLNVYDKRVLGIYHSNFSNFIFSKKPNLILADLGISSYHYQISKRGFSFQKEEFLDMRLEPQITLNASDILHTYSKEKLIKIFYEYGEETWSKKIVEELIKFRKREKIDTTTKLAYFISNIIPKKFWKKNIHPATKVFQALRIEVNQELEHIKKGIVHLFENLEDNGLLFVISFHSLEDRIIKTYFKTLNLNYQLITKKPIQPSESEKWENKSARSAKLRVVRKTKKAKKEKYSKTVL